MASNTAVTIIGEALVRVGCNLTVPPDSSRYLWRKIENRPDIGAKQLGSQASVVIHGILSVEGVDRLIVWPGEVWVYPHPLRKPADIYSDVSEAVERIFQE